MPSKLFYSLSLLVVVAVSLNLGSCSRGGKKYYDTTAEDSLIIEAADSVTNSEPPQPVGPNLEGTENQLLFMQKCGAWERYKTGILPQMAEEVPEYCEKLLNSEFPYFIIVDKNKMKLFLYDKYGNIVKSYGIACARNFGHKHKKGDNRTSEGYFTAEGIYDSTNWLFTDDNGYTSPVKGSFGPRFIRVDVPGTRAIGIHGTSSRYSMGHRASHGCVRLLNENILDLVEYAQVGMPIIISPGPRDMAVNEKEGCFIPSVTTEPGGSRAVAGPKIMDEKSKEEIAKELNEANKKLEEMNSESSDSKSTESSKENIVNPSNESGIENSSPESTPDSKPVPETPKTETEPTSTESL